MSEKRRDNKGRVLRNGESQEKNGRYTYKYTDALGERKTVRSWRLVKTDMTPLGKHPTISLREMEEEIQTELSKGIGNNDMANMLLKRPKLTPERGLFRWTLVWRTHSGGH